MDNAAPEEVQVGASQIDYRMAHRASAVGVSGATTCALCDITAPGYRYRNICSCYVAEGLSS